jgi:hypothetical protein
MKKIKLTLHLFPHKEVSLGSYCEGLISNPIPLFTIYIGASSPAGCQKLEGLVNVLVPAYLEHDVYNEANITAISNDSLILN